MLGVGLTAVRKTTGIPLEMPPLTPALWLVAVTMEMCIRDSLKEE